MDRVTASKVLRISTDPSYPPQSFMDADNQMVGFDIDVARAIATELDATLEIVTPAWEIVVSGRWNGRWDLSVGSMTPTQERSQALSFPAVYYYVPAAFAVHERSRVKAPAELTGRTFGVCGECTYEAYLRGTLTLPEATAPLSPGIQPGEIRTYETDLNALDDLKLGDGVRINAVLSSLPTINNAIEKGYPLRVVGPPVFYEPLAVAAEPGDAEFDARVAAIIAKLKADGVLSALSQKWYGMDLTRKE